MNVNDLTLGQIKELRSLFSLDTAMAKKEILDGGIRIVVLQRGWVVVGRFSQHGNECKLSSAAIIRRWGTTKGLGEIAENGPTEETILDATPDITFHELTSVLQIQCEEKKWKSKLT